MPQMQYRRLGRAGVKVSQLSFGSWITFGSQMELKPVLETMAAARDYGVNFFDNAEVYAGGKSEELMGQALKKLNWPRLSYLISTKFFWGITEGENSQNTLNRKYLSQAINNSLKRLQTDFVDIVYCHRPDPYTPLEETVWAMHDMITQGKALYWGTSEWSAEEFRAAWQLAEKYHLHKPIVEQPQYNLMHRDRVEREYLRLYEDIGLGLTIWSPLASGMLTGKYLEKIPDDSRAALQSMSWIRNEVTSVPNREKVQKFVNLAKELDAKPAQLAIAWCTSNPNVSTVITGASRVEQVHENMQSLRLLDKLTPEVVAQLDVIFGH